MSINLENITAPPLDMDLNSIDTSIPLLAPAIYDLQINKVEPKNSKAGAPMFSLDLITTAPAQTQDGNQVGPGLHVFHNLNLQPSGAAKWDVVLRNIAAVTQAAGLATSYGEFVANGVSMLQGKTVRCKVGVTPAGTDKNGKSFRAKNEVDVWMKAQ